MKLIALTFLLLIFLFGKTQTKISLCEIKVDASKLILVQNEIQSFSLDDQLFDDTETNDIPEIDFISIIINEASKFLIEHENSIKNNLPLFIQEYINPLLIDLPPPNILLW